MKIETLVILSDNLLHEIDHLLVHEQSRSEFIEAAVWSFIEHQMREEQAVHDLEIINQSADRLNEEALDVLEYQTIP